MIKLRGIDEEVTKNILSTYYKATKLIEKIKEVETALYFIESNISSVEKKISISDKSSGTTIYKFDSDEKFLNDMETALNNLLDRNNQKLKDLEWEIPTTNISKIDMSTSK